MAPFDNFLNKYLPWSESQKELDLKHLSAPWAKPGHQNLVMIYLKKNDGWVKSKGRFDADSGTWFRTNGKAVEILGWSE